MEKQYSISYNINLSYPISLDLHPDILNELQAKRFLNWTGTKIHEEVAWTLREHSTKN